MLWGTDNSMDETLPGMLLSLLIILKVFGSTEASCSLTQVAGSLTANCAHKGLTSVPQNLPTGITHLRLRSNLITTLDQSDFLQYGSLTYLDLKNNSIATINSQAFYTLSNLIDLDLNGNRLSNLRSDMFTGLGNLETLWLNDNKISDIQTATFSSTPQLKYLSLRNNKLSSLISDMFTGLGNLEELWLNDNEISDIQAGTFSSTPQLKYLSLQSNKLTSLRSDMFTGLKHLEELYVYNNEILSASVPPDQPHPASSLSLPVLIGLVGGSGTVLVGAVILTIWCKRKTRNSPSGQTPPVALGNPPASVTICDHDQTEEGGDQATNGSLQNSRSSDVPGHGAVPQVLEDEYEDVVLPPRNVKTGPNGAELRQQPNDHEYQSLGRSRNRSPGDELPPLPSPRNCINSGTTGADDTLHYYQSLKKTTPTNSRSKD